MHVFALTTDQEYLTDKKLATFPFDGSSSVCFEREMKAKKLAFGCVASCMP
jgi:hypothetical protein